MATDEADDPTGPHGDKDGLSESLRQRLETLVPDLVRRTFTAGMGAVFSTEDSLRRLSKELNVPSVAGYLGDAADSTKEKVLEVVAREVREFLTHVNLSDEIAKMLTTLSLEVKTEIRFIPNSERFTGVDPDVKAAVRIKRAERARERDREPVADAPAPSPEPRAAAVSRLRRLWRRATEPVRDVIADVTDGDEPGEPR
ncbi:MAG: hypothetical protein IPL61_04715 [Myxococcales bacterium]|nr:hypothetical protein [Myxococcales bacterium]